MNLFRPAIRVGMLLPVWCCGGLERYHLALARSTSENIEWIGCALTDRAPTLQPMIDELAAVMPVCGTMNLADPGLNGMERIVRYGTEREALERILPECDVLLTWGVRDLNLLNGFNSPIVLISHGACDWTRGILDKATRQATHFAAVSQAAARAFPREIQSRVMIQPAGVEMARVTSPFSRAEARRIIGVTPEHRLVGYVGRFSPEKNPYQAAKIVGELGAPYVAVMHGAAIVGDAEVRAEARRLSGDRVLFLDRNWHLGTVLAGLDCLIQASPSEGGPLVALESWCAGLPMISTDVGVIRDDRKHIAGFTTIMPVNATLDRWVEATIHSCTAEKRAVSEAAVPSMRLRYGSEAMGRNWEQWLTAITGRRP